ncbi:macrophage mannose receptor 1-like isoform X6, partial [Clarias magur]
MKHLFLLLCLSAQSTGTAKFVGISSVYLTWPQARDYCRTYYTDLASSLNSSDNSLLGQIQDTQGYSWIGLYNDKWIWSDGTASDFQWAPGQIIYYSGSGCATAYTGQFNQETCTNQHYFYCYTYRPEREQQIMRLQVESDASVFVPAVQSTILEK